MSEEKYQVKWTSRFKKDFKLAQKRGYDIQLLKEAVHLIALGDQQRKLAEEYDDHPLTGDWKGHRELHIQPDWLLIYYIQYDVLVLTLSRTGTHSDLFDKQITGYLKTGGRDLGEVRTFMDRIRAPRQSLGSNGTGERRRPFPCC